MEELPKTSLERACLVFLFEEVELHAHLWLLVKLRFLLEIEASFFLGLWFAGFNLLIGLCFGYLFKLWAAMLVLICIILFILMHTLSYNTLKFGA